MSARPLPRPTPNSQPFWDACREHRLIVQQCQSCGMTVFTPQEFCRSCSATDLEWVPSAGCGEVVTFTVVHRPQTPAFEAPYVVAVVQLDEGFQMLTNIVGDEKVDVAIGSRVGVSFVDLTDEFSLPCFRLGAD